MLVQHYVEDVLKESTTLNVLQSRIHGLDHCFRVWKNAELLVERGQLTQIDQDSVDMEVVALFALFHDCMRENDHQDPEHGLRGWLLFQYLYDGSGHMLTHGQKQLLMTAMCDHSMGTTNPDPTVAVCWDADRLDIHRQGIWPDHHYLSTGAGRLLALGRVNPRIDQYIYSQLDIR